MALLPASLSSLSSTALHFLPVDAQTHLRGGISGGFGGGRRRRSLGLWLGLLLGRLNLGHGLVDNLVARALQLSLGKSGERKNMSTEDTDR